MLSKSGQRFASEVSQSRQTDPHGFRFYHVYEDREQMEYSVDRLDDLLQRVRCQHTGITGSPGEM
jgi:hypothetical protein